LKVFADLELIERNPDLPVTVMLYPFTGIFPEQLHDSRSPMKARFDRYCSGNSSVELASEEEADYFVFPFEYYGLADSPDRTRLLGDFFERAERSGKQGIVFAYGDEWVDLSSYPSAIVYQSNLERSKMNACDRAMPAFVEDLVANMPGRRGRRSGALRRRLGMRVRPTVSFCGFSGSAQVRVELLRVVSNSRLVKSRFVDRKSYFGGAWDKKIAGYDFKKLTAVRTEYVSSLLGADYVLCVRGWGNYSARFYEAMCCGKIPVFLDTDCALPFEDKVDYDSAIVRIAAADLGRADRLLRDFDEGLSEQEFQDRQMRCRRLWEDFLSPEGFFRTLGNSPP
jgi:hypothetical protein